MRSTQPLRDALAEYDAGQPARDAAWDAIESDADFAACCKADGEALRKVQEAFYDLTSDRNTKVNCYHTDLAYLRRIAAKNGIEDIAP